MPRPKLVQVWCPVSVLRALDELDRKSEPGHTALNVVDRTWSQRTGVHLLVHDRNEAIQLYHALWETGFQPGRSQRTTGAALRLASILVARFELTSEERLEKWEKADAGI